MPQRFDVFLSHNSKDKTVVRELAEALESRGLKVWLDEWELVPGRTWQNALEEVIHTVQSAAVLVGKDGIGPWEEAEMFGCLHEFVERKLPVIPVLLPGAPQKPPLPLFLKQFTWVNLRDGLTEKGLDQLQWGVSGKRPDRSKSQQLILEPVIDPALEAHHVVEPAGPRSQAVSNQPFQTLMEKLASLRPTWKILLLAFVAVILMLAIALQKACHVVRTEETVSVIAPFLL